MKPLQLSYDPRPAPSSTVSPLVNTAILDVHRLSNEELIEHYEAGDVITFPFVNFGFSEADWELINLAKSPAINDNFYKKSKMRSLLAPRTGERHVLDLQFPGKRDLVEKMIDLITRSTPKFRDWVHQRFPKYKFLGEHITWRLTRTEHEEMHYDSYGAGGDPLHHVRLFVNIDWVPRLWGVGPTVDNTIARYRNLVRPFEQIDPNQFTAKLNAVLPWLDIPRHFVAFAPGNVWMVNSQVTAHEIMYGRRMVACTFDVEPSSMRNPDQLFSEIVRRSLRDTP